MPKKEKTKVAKGEHNPRHFILLPIGVGNMYCRNCEGLIEDDDGEGSCRIFLIDNEYTYLKGGHYGPIRCAKCKAGEKALEELKQKCRDEGFQNGSTAEYRKHVKL